MKTKRRNFDKDCKAAMLKRATDASGQLRCEGCGLAIKKSEAEFDHIIAEGLLSDEDKKRKLTPADGQVLGAKCCHRGPVSKTSSDQSKIAKAKRQESKHFQTSRPKQSIRSRNDLASGKARTKKPDLPPRKLYQEIER